MATTLGTVTALTIGLLVVSACMRRCSPTLCGRPASQPFRGVKLTRKTLLSQEF